jgi:hypothetical protein
MKVKQKQSSIQKMNRILAGMFLIILSLMPMVMAYELGLPAFDLYTALVDYIFGSFWLAVGFMIGIMFFILTVIGNLSALTSFEFIMFFFYAISIGYSSTTAIFAFVAITAWAIFQVFRAGNTASY